MTNTVAADGASSNPAIRHATVSDADALSAFAAHVFHETFAPDNDPLDMHAYLTDAFTPVKQAAEIADPSRVCLIAEVGDAMAGYAMLRDDTTDPLVPGGRPVELQRFYVDRAWHGHGVAAQLMAACLHEAAERGGVTLWLGVWERNARAIRFYTKQGFADIGSQEFRLGSDLQTDRVMSRPVVMPDAAGR